MISVEMRTLAAPVAIATVAVVLVACGDDDDATVTPAGPTTISVEKSFVAEDGGEFTFTVQITNEGENSAVRVELSDAWADGLTVTSIGDLDGAIADLFPDDRGFEVQIDDLKAGESKQIVYVGSCASSGQWTNSATVSSANADSASTSVSISCP
jgi:uncharacterized repeat protein (TIGR01451 family)